MNKIANGDENSRLPQVAERDVSSAGLSADSVKKLFLYPARSRSPLV